MTPAELQYESEESISKYADMLAAMGAEPRLRIMRLLLSTHPKGMVVGEIMAALATSPSTLSHHLDKLKNERLVTVERHGTFLRFRANVPVLRDLLQFFCAECCTRNAVIDLRELMSCDL
jgi:ArsR family transcriptional regulator